ncbi:MAG: biotin--[acetyl-CoA-carboxylase] ligase [Acidobacteriaceae bacterium]|jgi:BirA family biotin operon repressor/biotin-[acetyl-CoA-carboxylase] ligase
MSNQPSQSNQPSASPGFNLAEVESAIASTQFAGHLHHLATTPSTNAVALKAAQSGARSGVWIADEQIAGRGRGGHAWHSPAGAGLYMTALVSPPIPMQSALQLSFRVAIAVQSAIASTFGFRIREQIDIRWPNDLMLARANGPARKCGGILIDTASNPAAPPLPAMLRYAIIGIGINLNHTTFPPDLDPIATSLRRELPDPSQPHRREPLAAAILLALDAEIRKLATDNLQPATCNLSQYSTWLQGKRVRIEPRDDDHGGYTGTTAGLDPNGFLLVAGDDGQLHTVLSGGLREP